MKTKPTDVSVARKVASNVSAEKVSVAMGASGTGSVKGTAAVGVAGSLTGSVSAKASAEATLGDVMIYDGADAQGLLTGMLSAGATQASQITQNFGSTPWAITTDLNVGASVSAGVTAIGDVSAQAGAEATVNNEAIAPSAEKIAGNNAPEAIAFAKA